MLRNLVVILTLALYSLPALVVPEAANAQTSLSRAVIESVRNRVRLIPQNQSARAARPSDVMTPGDALATAANSTADVRFNDRSLARLGEQAVFRFAPGTRTVDLTRGTMVLLVSPGQGSTNVRTPNSAAGIRGSALFVRYIPETDTTLVGALTNSGIEVFNQTGSERLELNAGQMAVLVKDRIERVYNFDLGTFYQTSSLLKDLNLLEVDPTAPPDEAMNQVRAEVQEGLATQVPIASANAIANPDFVRLPRVPVISPNPVEVQDFPALPDFNATVVNLDPNVLNGNLNGVEPKVAVFENSSNVRSLLVGAETQATFQRVNPFPDLPTIFPDNNLPGNVLMNDPSLGGNMNGNLPGGGNPCRSLPGRGNLGRVHPGRGNNCRVFPGHR